jgi:hypothetical protein
MELTVVMNFCPTSVETLMDMTCTRGTVRNLFDAQRIRIVDMSASAFKVQRAY